VFIGIEKYKPGLVRLFELSYVCLVDLQKCFVFFFTKLCGLRVVVGERQRFCFSIVDKQFG